MKTTNSLAGQHQNVDTVVIGGSIEGTGGL